MVRFTKMWFIFCMRSCLLLDGWTDLHENLGVYRVRPGILLGVLFHFQSESQNRKCKGTPCNNPGRSVYTPKVLHSSVSSKFHFYIQNYIDSNSTIFFKKMHIKIKFLQKLPKELLIIVLLDTTEPFLLMDKLDLVKHSQLQEKFTSVDAHHFIID